MWHLIEDFFEQNLVMKALTLLGWVAVFVMGSSLIYTGNEALKAAQADQQPTAEQPLVAAPSRADRPGAV